MTFDFCFFHSRVFFISIPLIPLFIFLNEHLLPILIKITYTIPMEKKPSLWIIHQSVNIRRCTKHHKTRAFVELDRNFHYPVIERHIPGNEVSLGDKVKKEKKIAKFSTQKYSSRVNKLKESKGSKWARCRHYLITLDRRSWSVVTKEKKSLNLSKKQ